jgi:4-amino-4-deoxy-L-arabinose transferase-like glycosyltransferase
LLGTLFFRHSWLALVPAIVMYASPYLYYYGLNFLPDVPAFSLSVVGTFLLVKFFVTRRLPYLYCGFAAFCLACLLKITAGIPLAAIIASLVLSRPWRNKHFQRSHAYHFCRADDADGGDQSMVDQLCC